MPRPASAVPHPARAKRLSSPAKRHFAQAKRLAFRASPFPAVKATEAGGSPPPRVGPTFNHRPEPNRAARANPAPEPANQASTALAKEPSRSSPPTQVPNQEHAPHPTLRWLHSRGEKGPWSGAAKATIAA